MADEDDEPVLRVRSVPDLLALVPVTLGFEPTESLVVIAAAGRYPGFTARVDLPPRGKVANVTGQMAEQMAAAVVSQGCTRVAVVVFSRRREPAETVASTTAELVERAGVELYDVLRTDGRRYWSMMCRDESCCPPEGTPYDPWSTPLRAQAAVAGRAVAPDRAALAARFAAPGGDERAAARAAIRRAEDDAVAELGLRGRRQLRHLTPGEQGSALPRGAVRVDTLLDVLLGPDGTDPHLVAQAVTGEHAATLAVWCAMLPVRDLAWSRMSRPDAARHFALWTEVSRRVVPPYEPAVLCLTAFAAWLSGDGASAWCALDRCALADRSYSMAGLVAEILLNCVSPDEYLPLPRDVILQACGAPTSTAMPHRTDVEEGTRGG